MIRKNYDDVYYELQNGRSGMVLDSNEIQTYFHLIIDKLPKNFYFLDVGCRGIAKTVEFMLRHTENSYGFDIGESAASMWGAHKFNDKLTLHDAHQPFPYEFKFHLISISHTLEHCHTPELVVDNMRDSLVTGGFIWSVVPIEVTDSHTPHYCIFQTHNEHRHMYSMFNVVWEYETNTNSYLLLNLN